MWNSIEQRHLYQYLFSIPNPNLSNHKGETKLHLECINHMKSWAVSGELKALWFHPANETLKKGDTGWGMLLKMMGKLPGVPDLIFLWDKGSGCIELKSSKGRLTEEQETFKKWCCEFNIPYVICRSLKEVERTLKDWKVLL
jgi:hypothetical protein